MGQDVEKGRVSNVPPARKIKSVIVGSISNRETKQENTRAWMMQDLYGYQMSRNYGLGLHNLAWARAVQKKPRDKALVLRDDDTCSFSNNNKPNGDSKVNNGGCVNQSSSVKVVIDLSSGDDNDERGEGELEEGEIDLSDSNVIKLESDLNDDVNKLERRIAVIREALQSVNTSNLEESYDAVCFLIKNSLDSLWEVVLEDSDSNIDELIKLAYGALNTLNDMFVSMSQKQKEQNKLSLSRLLCNVASQNPPLFATEQMKEIEYMIKSLESGSPFPSPEDTDKKNKVENEHEAKTSIDFTKLETSNFKDTELLLLLPDLHKDHDEDSFPSPTRDAPSIVPAGNAMDIGSGVIKPEWPAPPASHEAEDDVMSYFQTSALEAVSVYHQKFGLTSLHISDLPSPTPSEDGDNGNGDTDGKVTSSSIVGATVKTVTAPTMPQLDVSPLCAMDICSSQAMHHTKNTMSMKSSEKSRDPRLRFPNLDTVASRVSKVDYIGGTTGPKKQKLTDEHVSNGSILERQKNGPTNVRTAAISASTGSSTTDVMPDGFEYLPGTSTRNSSLLDSILEEFAVNPAILTNQYKLEQGKTVVDMDTVASRVCEVNYMGGTAGSKKQKPTDEFVSNDMTLRRQKSGPAEFGTAAISSSTGSSIKNIMVDGFERFPGTSTCNTSSLESILKEFDVNPAILSNIMKTEQQNNTSSLESILKEFSVDPVILMNLMKTKHESVADPVENLKHVSSSNFGAINVALPKSTEGGQNSVGIFQASTQATSTDQLEKIDFKARDPRRALHSKVGKVGLNHIKTSAPAITNSLETRICSSSCNQPDRKVPPLKNTTASEVPCQNTKNRKDIADIVSVSQTPTTTHVNPRAPSYQPSQDVPHHVDNHWRTICSSQEVSVASTPPRNAFGDVEHLFKGLDEEQKAALHKERGRRIDEQKKMFAARKLCLVLDLDHTLLNSAKFSEVDPAHDIILRKKEERDRKKPYRHLFRIPHMGMWTKLRPGIWNFLEKASKLFELHLYTMGNKMYATEMAKLLDPKGTLFAGRVMSRGDDDDGGDIFKSKDLEGVLGMESGVIIIDDTIRVWPHHKLNLIVVERYIYFPFSRRQFGLLGPSLLEIGHDEKPEVGTLASSLAVIERIHQNFFAHRSLEEADIRNILASEQRKVLGGCRIVFSRMFPVGEVNPRRHPLWQIAEQFGAICTSKIDERVTHVVANSLGTSKVKWARSAGKFVVRPGWVEASTFLYRRANEQDFAVKP